MQPIRRLADRLGRLTNCLLHGYSCISTDFANISQVWQVLVSHLRYSIRDLSVNTSQTGASSTTAGNTCDRVTALLSCYCRALRMTRARSGGARAGLTCCIHPQQENNLLRCAKLHDVRFTSAAVKTEQLASNGCRGSCNFGSLHQSAPLT